MTGSSVDPPFEADLVRLMLAGLTNEAEAARRMGVDQDELRLLLTDLNLGHAAMVPVAIDDELASYYADLGLSAFDVPLFDEVVESYRMTQANANTVRFRLSADAMLCDAAMSLSRTPDGLVFHVGRCGSTLLCNLLVSVGGWVALREPEFLNTLFLRLSLERDRARKERVEVLIAQSLRSLAHGVHLDAERRERACMVKLSSWNAMVAERLVTTFDTTPLVVVTRDPCATVASFLHNPPHWHDCRSEGGSRMKAARLFAEVWSRTIEATLRFPSQRTLFVDYAELVAEPVVTLQSLCRHLGDIRARPDSNAIAVVMANYSKGPYGERYDPNSRHRLKGLDDTERDLVESITAASRAALGDRTSPRR